MKLIVDNTNVETIPVGNLQDLGEMARELGRRLDEGYYGNVISVVTLIAKDDGLGTFTWGAPRNGYELMGLFEVAKLRVFADDVVDD